MIFLFPGLVCEHWENSKLIFHLKYFYFCLFLTSISVSRPELKLPHGTNFYLSAWKLWRKVSYRPPIIYVRNERIVGVAPLDVCPLQLQSRSKTLCQWDMAVQPQMFNCRSLKSLRPQASKQFSLIKDSRHTAGHNLNHSFVSFSFTAAALNRSAI